MASETTGAQVVVPAGALAASTAIAVTRSSTGAPALPAGLVAFGPMFAFTPHGTHFAVPATIIIPFDAASVPQGTAPRLFKTNATQSGWEEVQGATVEGGVMKGPVTGFSFAVVAGEPSTSTNLSVSSIDPDHGPAHTLVRLIGQGFSATPEDNDVRLNNKSCVVREASTTGLTVEVPRQAGSGNFQVFTQNGTAQSAMFTYEVTAVQVTTIAGGEGGFVDDVGSAARFMSVAALAVSASGTIFVADSGNHAVRVVSPSVSVGTLAGGSEGHADGVGSTAKFIRPSGLALDSDGSLYVSDQGSPGRPDSYVRKIAPNGLVTTVVSAEGGTNILFDIAGSRGAFFVTDLQQSAVLSVDLSQGSVTTLAGGAPGDVDARGADARFFFPEGIASCGGDLFVSDSGNSKIRKIAPDGTVTTLTGSEGGISFQDGTLAEARFLAPDGIACDTDGKLFVVDFGNRRIRMITPSGIVTTLAGSLPGGIQDGDATTARFGAPGSIAVDASGVLYIGDGTRLRTLTWE